MNNQNGSTQDIIQRFVLGMKDKKDEEIQRSSESLVFEFRQFVPKRFWGEIWKCVVIRAYKAGYAHPQIATLCLGLKDFALSVVPEDQFNFVVENISKGYLYNNRNFSDYAGIVLKIKKLNFAELDEGIISGE